MTRLKSAENSQNNFLDPQIFFDPTIVYVIMPGSGSIKYSEFVRFDKLRISAYGYLQSGQPFWLKTYLVTCYEFYHDNEVGGYRLLTEFSYDQFIKIL
jgi:hypothetical protein